VPKVYVVLGLGALYFFLVFFNIAANFLVNTIGFAIPAYYSLDALFTTKTTDDTQVSLSIPYILHFEHAILTIN
jgi:receptor expression-enhancing protein 5/6